MPLKTEPTLTLSPKKYRLTALELWRPIPSRHPRNPKALYWRQAGKPIEFPPSEQLTFEPGLGRPNVWTIEPPSSWLEQTRQTWTAATQPAGDAASEPAPAR